jgi:hypothetical protein
MLESSFILLGVCDGPVDFVQCDWCESRGGAVDVEETRFSSSLVLLSSRSRTLGPQSVFPIVTATPHGRWCMTICKVFEMIESQTVPLNVLIRNLNKELLRCLAVICNDVQDRVHYRHCGEDTVSWIEANCRVIIRPGGEILPG